MSTDRWHQIERLFHEASARPAAGRAAFLDQACAGDAQLRREVQALLDSPASALGVLDGNAMEVAAGLVGTSSTSTLAGRRLGGYQLLERIGAGGMGEVYRARDLRLDRDVAIKILPREFTADPDRQARFAREARVLASLNHPNIGAVYGVEEDSGHTEDSVRGIVLELVEGETLADRIRHGALPLADALALASQIADALDAAHQKGIVHRDLKPSNIKIAPGGVVKVLDFGLAKTSAVSASSAPPGSTVEDDTAAGVILGTAAYMSPEQARGQPVDKRTDIWAFGCVLYEMLTGRSPFAGATITDTLASILEREPAWSELPQATPPGVVRLLERCLTKEISDRMRDIGDVRPELDEARAGGIAAVRRSRPTSRVPGERGRRVGWWVAAAAALMAAAVLGWRLGPDATVLDPLQGATFTRLTDWEGGEQQAAISPDGRFVAFISDRDGAWDAWVGQIGTDRFNNLTSGRVPELRNPAVPNVGFTPDGSLVTLWVRLTDPQSGVQTNGWVVPTLGGPPRPYMDRYASNIADVDWSPDLSRLVYHTSDAGDPLFVALSGGTEARQILESEPGIHNHFPVWSPDGAYIYFARGVPPDKMDVWRITPEGGAPERLTFHQTRVAFPTFLDRRTLLYLASDEGGSGPWLHALDVERRTANRISTGVEAYTSIDASADGRRLVGTVSRVMSGLWRATITQRPIGDGQATRLALPTARGLSPRLGPGYLVYRASTAAGTDGLWKLSEGQQPTELWSGRDGRVVAAAAIAPGGRHIAFAARRQTATRLFAMDADGGGVRVVTEQLDVRGAPAWSPDGRWIAIAAERDGQPRLFKVPVAGGAPVQLTDEYALDPAWAPSGRFLVYSGPDVGMTFPVRAVTADGGSYPLPELILSRGARRLGFLGSDAALLTLRGDISHRDLWVRDLQTGRQRQLTAMGRDAAISDFDVSADGRQIVFDRSREESDIVLIERPAAY